MACRCALARSRLHYGNAVLRTPHSCRSQQTRTRAPVATGAFSAPLPSALLSIRQTEVGKEAYCQKRLEYRFNRYFQLESGSDFQARRALLTRLSSSPFAHVHDHAETMPPRRSPAESSCTTSVCEQTTISAQESGATDHSVWFAPAGACCAPPHRGGVEGPQEGGL